jgi:hypothetical protein
MSILFSATMSGRFLITAAWCIRRLQMENRKAQTTGTGWSSSLGVAMGLITEMTPYQQENMYTFLSMGNGMTKTGFLLAIMSVQFLSDTMSKNKTNPKAFSLQVCSTGHHLAVAKLEREWH